ncbi:G-protein coupled receptor 4-like [Fundulus heteroclitus]|uniref:G-protein coupled receptor 4-like n=1 Tax=Fundulus heteroclitus TaxID=8078 RepID=UPI00165AD61C|nr:G-protein coupled receptor 4-like [Fundulus heteroclitus]
MTSIDKSLADIFKVTSWVDWITIGIGLPFTLVVLVAVFLQVKKNQGCPIFVINLLFSDLIQFCGRITFHSDKLLLIGLAILGFGLFASLGFMVCISLERYLVVAKPLWYRFRRNIKTYVVVCVVVWVLPVLFNLIVFPLDLKTVAIISSCVVVTPIPVFIFCLVGTIKALSGALSVPADEKRRITAIQVAVLLTYILLFPNFIVFTLSGFTSFTPQCIFYVCVSLSPLADTTLYLLSRKSFLDKFLASLCSCKTSDSQEMNTRDIEITTVANTETV